MEDSRPVVPPAPEGSPPNDAEGQFVEAEPTPKARSEDEARTARRTVDLNAGDDGAPSGEVHGKKRPAPRP